MPRKISPGQLSIFDVVPTNEQPKSNGIARETDDQTHQGYSPGHPWYYKLGGRVLSVEEIRPAQFSHYDPIHRRKSGKPFPALEVQLTVAKRQLEQDIDRYNLLISEGDKACSSYDLTMGYDAHFNLFLVHNHISYYKGTIAKLEEAISRYGL